jgi:pyrroline-5-carboxylate reductase
MLKSPLSLDELMITQVRSPGGTTVKGLQALIAAALTRRSRCCIDDCVERAYELANRMRK